MYLHAPVNSCEVPLMFTATTSSRPAFEHVYAVFVRYEVVPSTYGMGTRKIITIYTYIYNLNCLFSGDSVKMQRKLFTHTITRERSLFASERTTLSAPLPLGSVIVIVHTKPAELTSTTSVADRSRVNSKCDCKR